MAVYLLHFDAPLHHARHYIGYAKDIDARLDDHRTGNGARIMQAVADAGITWRLARVWPDAGRPYERQLKRQKHAARFCPICNDRTHHYEH